MKEFIERNWPLWVVVAVIVTMIATMPLPAQQIPPVTVEEKILGELILIRKNTDKLRGIEEQRMKEIPIFLKKGGLPGVVR